MHSGFDNCIYQSKHDNSNTFVQRKNTHRTEFMEDDLTDIDEHMLGFKYIKVILKIKKKMKEEYLLAVFLGYTTLVIIFKLTLTIIIIRVVLTG